MFWLGSTLKTLVVAAPDLVLKWLVFIAAFSALFCHPLMIQENTGHYKNIAGHYFKIIYRQTSKRNCRHPFE